MGARQTRYGRAKQYAFDHTPAIVFLTISALWGAAWVLGFTWDLLKTRTEQPLNDIFLSVNTLFAGLAFFGIIWTSFTQYKDLKESKALMASTAAANKSMAETSERMAETSERIAKHADEKTVLDLFQTYCSEYFQTVKDRSMNVLIASVRCRHYGEYLVSRLFVGGQLKPPGEEFQPMLVGIPGWETREGFLANERHDRYKLDELINFFSLLVGLSDAGNAIKRCDFSYSWWRPLLWMIAIEQERRFNENYDAKFYSTGLYLRDVVITLDKVYKLEPFPSDDHVWAFILGHPKIREYGIDPAYFEAHRQLPHMSPLPPRLPKELQRL